jgi:double-stranded uracil-DNA glycosylase
MLVICGTAASAKSARLGQYYAGLGNKFWWVLARTGLTPMQLSPSEYTALPKYGIGLTDLVKGQSGNDDAIQFDRGGRAPLEQKIRKYQPKVFCFNGKRAAQGFFDTKAIAYGVQAERVGETILFVAPSTSGAANGFWDLTVWEELAELVRTP